MEFLAQSGQKVWQVLPLHPTGYGNSPYQCFSAFAGNPLLIDLRELCQQGLLSSQDLTEAPRFPEGLVHYGEMINFKHPQIRRAARNSLAFGSQADHAAFNLFCRRHSAWLDDYALFMACKDIHKGVAWAKWEPRIRLREPSALNEARQRLSAEIEVHKYAQFEFFRQWEKLKDYCRNRGIKITGDIPIYVAHDSADVWAHPELFRLDPNGIPVVVAGVPPDYFSATGQLWGNPLYRWDVLADSGYQWWVDRFRASLTLFDYVRLDHFRGFEAYWEIPAAASRADRGRWLKGPGVELFQNLQAELKQSPVVAENLGVINPRSRIHAQAVWFSRNEPAAVCLRQGSPGADLPPS